MDTDIRLLTFIFHTIPECTAFSLFVLAFTNKLTQWKKGLALGFLFALVTFLIRFLPIIQGVHTLLLFFAVIFFLYSFIDVKLFSIVKVCFLGFFIVAMGEVISFTILINLFNLTYDQMINSFFWVIILALFQVSLFGIVILIVLIRNKNFLIPYGNDYS